MIDGLVKDHIDPLWERAALPLVRLGMSPNQVTLAGLALIVAASAAYLWHGSEILFGVSLAIAFAFDSLDGAVARLTDRRTRLGGYLDAMVDRYQELIVLAAIGYPGGLWFPTLAAFSGGMLTSYAKARTAVEIPISNEAWPDLFERLERVIFLCALLVAAGIADSLGYAPGWLVLWGLVLFAALAHFTALQRMLRAKRLLAEHDRRMG